MSVAIELDQEQTEAVNLMVKTLTATHQDTIAIAGAAGTGKTTILRSVLDQLPMYNIVVATFTGKAAHVLRQKGIPDAQTLHSLMYDYDPEEDEFHKVVKLTRGHDDLYNGVPVDAVIVDEASTVSQALYDDLMDFGLPVVFVGDNHQLEPVGANPGLMTAPDYELTTIYRQEEGNGILDVAHAFRTRQRPEWNDDAELIPRSKSIDRLLDYDVVLCGLNGTRQWLNQKVRALRGRGDVIEEGETVVVLRNNAHHGVFNGMLMQVETIHRRTKFDLRVTLHDPDTGRRVRNATAVMDEGQNLKQVDRDTIIMDYGYCISTHKFQGSQTESVLVFEERGPWEQPRWNYTAASRAMKRLGWVR